MKWLMQMCNIAVTKPAIYTSVALCCSTKVILSPGKCPASHAVAGHKVCARRSICALAGWKCFPFPI